MTDEEIVKIAEVVEEKLRVAILPANPDDLILIEVVYGLLSPEDHNHLGYFLEKRGFHNVAIVYVAPNRGNLKYTVIQKDLIAAEKPEISSA